MIKWETKSARDGYPIRVDSCPFVVSYGVRTQ